MSSPKIRCPIIRRRGDRQSCSMMRPWWQKNPGLETRRAAIGYGSFTVLNSFNEHFEQTKVTT